MRVPLPFTALVPSIAAIFARYESTPSPDFATAKETGNYGERVAATFLRRHGYRVLYRNFLTEQGEIDLVCRHRDVLVFVEVRTRAGVAFGRPVETIDLRKQEALRFAAERYLRRLDHPDQIHYRFDAVEIVLQPGQIPVCTLQPDLFS
jgi:putative endonuclease